MAEDAQRDLPEFGLPLPFFSGAHIELPLKFQRTVAEGCLTYEEANIQEAAAYLLGNEIARCCATEIPRRSLFARSLYIPQGRATRETLFLMEGVGLLMDKRLAFPGLGTILRERFVGWGSAAF